MAALKLIAITAVFGWGLALPEVELPDRVYPKGYWEKQFASGTVYSSYCNVTILVRDVPSVEARIDALMSKKEATRVQGYYNQAGKASTRILGYQVPAARVESACRQVVAMGTIQQFSVNRQGDPSQLAEIEERLAAIEGERQRRSEWLSRMPVAGALLAATAERLRASQTALRDGANKAYASITLVPE